MCQTLNRMVRATASHLGVGKLVDHGRVLTRMRKIQNGCIYALSGGKNAVVMKAPNSDRLCRLYPAGKSIRFVPLDINSATGHFLERRDEPALVVEPARTEHLRQGRYFDGNGEMVRVRQGPKEVVFANAQNNSHQVVLRQHFQSGHICRMVEGNNGQQQFYPLGYLRANSSFVELNGVRPILSLPARNAVSVRCSRTEISFPRKRTLQLALPRQNGNGGSANGNGNYTRRRVVAAGSRWHC